MNTPISPVTPVPKRLGKALGIGWLLVGALFLFDPFLSALDLLPDCIGYLCIALGLYRLSDLDARMAEAAKGARRLALVGAVRLAVVVYAFGFVSMSEQPMFILLVAFVMGVVDCIFLIPMWKSFSAGMIYLGSRNEGTAVFSRRDGTRSITEKYAAFSGVYFVLREVLAILPELTVLTDEMGGAETVSGSNLYDFVGLLRGVCVLASLVLGLIWLVSTVVYVCKLLSDKPFFANLRHKYTTEVLSRPDLFATRAVRLSFGLLIAATILSVDLFLDGYNMLPDLIPGALMILSLIMVRRYAQKLIPSVVAASLYTVFAAVTWVLQFFTVNQAQLGEVLEDPDLLYRFEIMSVMQVATAFLFCVAFLLVLRTLFTMVKQYTGLRASRADSSYAAERTEAIHGIIRNKLIVVGVFVVLTALSTLYQWIGIPLMPSLKDILGTDLELMGNFARTVVITAYQIMTEGYWFIDLALGAGLVGFTVSATGEISDQMEYSYMMKQE